jgi:hypothetical protein
MDRKVTPTTGLKLFEVVAHDDRTICLHEEWCHVHILGRKRELAQLQNPVQEIERALTHAVEVRQSTTYSDRLMYVGPAIGHGFFGNDCLHVVVQPTSPERGFVITVLMRRASAG